MCLTGEFSKRVKKKGGRGSTGSGWGEDARKAGEREFDE